MKFTQALSTAGHFVKDTGIQVARVTDDATKHVGGRLAVICGVLVALIGVWHDHLAARDALAIAREQHQADQKKMEMLEQQSHDRWTAQKALNIYKLGSNAVNAVEVKAIGASNVAEVSKFNVTKQGKK